MYMYNHSFVQVSLIKIKPLFAQYLTVSSGNSMKGHMGVMILLAH